MGNSNHELSKIEIDELLDILKKRFEKNMHRHQKMNFEDIKKRLLNDPKKLVSLFEMEKTGGEPDVFDMKSKPNEVIFIDSSKETPKGRRSVCYDGEALDSRKEFKPATSAMDMANEMGIDMLTEDEYRELQEIDEFDLKTSSWVKTPDSIRKLDGALFCDRRYDHVFVYHNGASSYYGVRGFRGLLKV